MSIQITVSLLMLRKAVTRVMNHHQIVWHKVSWHGISAYFFKCCLWHRPYTVISMWLLDRLFHFVTVIHFFCKSLKGETFCMFIAYQDLVSRFWNYLIIVTKAFTMFRHSSKIRILTCVHPLHCMEMGQCASRYAWLNSQKCSKSSWYMQMKP